MPTPFPYQFLVIMRQSINAFTFSFEIPIDKHSSSKQANRSNLESDIIQANIFRSSGQRCLRSRRVALLSPRVSACVWESRGRAVCGCRVSYCRVSQAVFSLVIYYFQCATFRVFSAFQSHFTSTYSTAPSSRLFVMMASG